MDPELIPEGKSLLNYLESVYKQGLLTAITDGWQTLDNLTQCIGEYPAILSVDVSGWNYPKYGDNGPGSYSDVIRESLNSAVDYYNRGGILEVHWHWSNPFLGLETGFDEVKVQLTSTQWENIIKPGTVEYNTMIADLDWHIDMILKPLADQNIPILWRPLHEINGGWFWWTCEDDPAKTAELWRIIFDYMQNDRGLHNCIWVYNEAKYDADKDWRIPYLPGTDYYDLVAIDLYQFDARDEGIITHWDGSTTSFRQVFDMLEDLHSGKMVALGEIQEIPNLEKTANGDANFAPWLYVLPWWYNSDGDFNCVDKPCNPCWWAKETYNHDFAINLNDLPDFSTITITANSQAIPGHVNNYSNSANDQFKIVYSLNGRVVQRPGIIKSTSDKNESLTIQVVESVDRNGWILRYRRIAGRLSF